MHQNIMTARVVSLQHTPYFTIV